MAFQRWQEHHTDVEKEKSIRPLQESEAGLAGRQGEVAGGRKEGDRGGYIR